jgi:hypothetical protein
LDALAVDGLGENGCRGGAVTGNVGGLGSDFLHQLDAHVFEFVFQFDLLGNGHAVLGDQRSAEGFVDHDVAALGAEGYLDYVSQGVDTFQDGVAAVLVEFDDLCSHALFLHVDI